MHLENMFDASMCQALVGVENIKMNTTQFMSSMSVWSWFRKAYKNNGQKEITCM